MNHFIYAMNSSDPAPAAGGDTKSWFYFYKWDVGGFAFVPLSEDDAVGYVPTSKDRLWFVMDGRILGCVEVHSFLPSLNCEIELHYDTRLIRVTPDTVELNASEKTGIAADQSTYEALKRSFDAQYPYRDQAFAAELGLT